MPVLVGEFSAPVWAPRADRYLADAISLFESYGFDWAHLTYRLPGDPNSPWNHYERNRVAWDVIAKGFKKN